MSTIAPPTRAPDTVVTTNDVRGSVASEAVRVKANVKVVYRFDTGVWPGASATETNLLLPYAVAINGRALDAFANGARSLACKGGSIVVPALQGDTVSLYLNSDAHPSHRQHPLYTIEVGAHDVSVLVKETHGKNAASDTPAFKQTRDETTAAGGPGKHRVDHYEAALTGDIWLKASHRYTGDEARALMPGDTAREIADAVVRIYTVLPKPELIVDFNDGERITMHFSDSDNPKNNITSYDLLKDGLTRVHPAGYAALLTAAKAAGVETLTMSSAWRPQLGSIAHRAGLALDVGYLVAGDKRIKLDRQELRGKGPHAGNVSDEEKRLFAEKQKAQRAQEAARVEYNFAQKTLDLVRARKEASQAAFELASAPPSLKSADTVRLTDKADRTSRASKQIEQDWQRYADQTSNKGQSIGSKSLNVMDEDQANAAVEAAQKQRKRAIEDASNADDAWKDELKKTQPVAVKEFRQALTRCACVKQLFDPWYMDADTRDSLPPQPNQQITGNEQLHSHHLHIGVFDKHLLGEL